MGLKSVGRLFGKVEISRLGQFGHLPWDQFLLIGQILSDDMGILPIFKLVTFKISISILNILLNKQVQKDGDRSWEAYKLIIKGILLVHVVTAMFTEMQNLKNAECLKKCHCTKSPLYPWEQCVALIKVPDLVLQ